MPYLLGLLEEKEMLLLNQKERLTHLELLLDVADDLACSGGSQSQAGHIREGIPWVHEFSIGRPKRHPPGGDAVRLVDREEGEGATLVEAAQHVGEDGDGDALRGDIKNLDAGLRLVQLGTDRVGRPLVLHAAEHAGVDALALQEADLVLHECEERRDHDCDAWEQ